jgi:hypothetical protein
MSNPAVPSGSTVLGFLTVVYLHFIYYSMKCSWVAAQLAASREGLSTMKLVN